MAKKQELEIKEEVVKDKDLKIKNFKEEIDKYIKQRIDEETKKLSILKIIKNKLISMLKKELKLKLHLKPLKQ